MRQTSFKWYFTVILALLITILGVIPIQHKSNGGITAGLGLSGINTTTLEKIRGLSDYTEPISNNLNFAFRANLVPSSNNGLINPRQNPPVWERILIAKQVRVILGFFFAIMVIALFFIFYRNSRNCSESDVDSFHRSWFQVPS